MAREFGPRSYNPENMDFVTSGNMPSSLPNSAMARKLPPNILLEASENPSTVEELAMALGVAVPCMEEEVRLLADATLLRQSGDRYVTTFYIMDGETSSRLRRTLRGNAIRAHPCYAALENAVKADFDRLLRVFSAIPGALLREQKNHAASNEICNSRMMVLNDCLVDSTLTLPAQPESSTAGMWIVLR